jgi:uncharacterized protein (DUF433 family)
MMPFMDIIADDLPITVDPQIMSGAPVFAGTRVPVSALFENLEAGVSLGDFLENFPTVRREQVVAVLEHSRITIEGLSLAP